MQIKTITLSEWGGALPDATGQLFHQPEALAVLDRYASGDLQLLAGYKGDRPAALLPVFVREGPFGTATVTSPPPGMHVPHLGPVVMPASPKQRKRESLNRRFVESALETISPGTRRLCHLVCSPGFEDPRPYQWNGLDLDIGFTYHVEVGDRSLDELLGSMSKGRRREIRSGRELPVTVEEGGRDAAKRVYEDTGDRLRAQNEPFDISWPFVRDVLAALEDRARVHVARGPAGEYLGGVIVLYGHDTAAFWLGGTRETYDNVSVNSLIHWDVIRTIHDDPALESVSRYDMVGAGIPRVSKFKSSFNPTLRPYYVVKSSGPTMTLAETAKRVLDRARVGLAGVRDRFQTPDVESLPGGRDRRDDRGGPAGVSADD